MWVQGRAGNALLQPNLTILFDLPGAIAEARRSQVRAPDKFEQLDLNFFERVRQEYLRRAKLDPKRFYMVDASQTREAIWDELKSLSLEI
jgi:dTMP kinase